MLVFSFGVYVCVRLCVCVHIYAFMPVCVHVCGSMYVCMSWNSYAAQSDRQHKSNGKLSVPMFLHLKSVSAILP